MSRKGSRNTRRKLRRDRRLAAEVVRLVAQPASERAARATRRRSQGDLRRLGEQLSKRLLFLRER